MKDNSNKNNNKNSNSNNIEAYNLVPFDGCNNPFIDAIAPYVTNVTIGNERYYLADADDKFYPTDDCSSVARYIKRPFRIVDRQNFVTNFLVSLNQLSQKNFFVFGNDDNNGYKKNKLEHLSEMELTAEELLGEQYRYLQQVISHIKMGSFAIREGNIIYRIDIVVHPHYPYARMGDQLFLFLQHSVYIQPPTAGDIIWSNMSNDDELSLDKYEDASFYGSGIPTSLTVVASCNKQVLLHFIERMRRLMIGAYHKFSGNTSLIRTMKEVSTDKFSIMAKDLSTLGTNIGASRVDQRRVGVYAIDFDLYKEITSFQARSAHNILAPPAIPTLPIHACASGIHKGLERIFSFLSCYGSGFYDNDFIEGLRKELERVERSNNNNNNNNEQLVIIPPMNTVPVDKNFGSFFTVLAIASELKNHYNIPASKMDITALTYISNCPTCEEFKNDARILKIPQKTIDAAYTIFGKKTMLIFFRIFSGFDVNTSEKKCQQPVKPLANYSGYFDVRKDVQGGHNFPFPNKKSRVREKQEEEKLQIEKPTNTMIESPEFIAFVSSQHQQFLSSETKEYCDILILQEHVNYTFSLATLSYLPKLYFNSILKLLEFWFVGEEDLLQEGDDDDGDDKESKKKDDGDDKESKKKDDGDDEESKKKDNGDDEESKKKDDLDLDELEECWKKKKKQLVAHQNIIVDQEDPTVEKVVVEQNSEQQDEERQQIIIHNNNCVVLSHQFCVFLVAVFHNRASALQGQTFQKMLEFFRGTSQVGKTLLCDILEESTSPQSCFNFKIGGNSGFDGEFSHLNRHNIFEEFSKITPKMADDVKTIINSGKPSHKKVKFVNPQLLKAFFFLANSNERAFNLKQPRDTLNAILNRILLYWNVKKTRKQVIKFQGENVSWFKNTSVIQKHLMATFTRFFMFTVVLPTEHYDSTRFRDYFPDQMRELAEEFKVEDLYFGDESGSSSSSTFISSSSSSSFNGAYLPLKSNNLLPSSNRIVLLVPTHKITFAHLWLYMKYFRKLLQQDVQQQIDRFIVPHNLDYKNIQHDFQNNNYGMDIFLNFFSDSKYYNALYTVLPIFPQQAFSNNLYHYATLQKIAQGIPVIAKIKDGEKRNQYQSLSWYSFPHSSPSSSNWGFRIVEVETIEQFLFHVICALNYLYDFQFARAIEPQHIKLSPLVKKLLLLGLPPDGTFHFNQLELFDCHNKFAYFFDTKMTNKNLSEQFSAVFDGKLQLIQTKSRAHRPVYNFTNVENNNKSGMKKLSAVGKRQYASYAIEFLENITAIENLFDLFFSRFSYADGKKLCLALKNNNEEQLLGDDDDDDDERRNLQDDNNAEDDNNKEQLGDNDDSDNLGDDSGHHHFTINNKEQFVEDDDSEEDDDDSEDEEHNLLGLQGDNAIQQLIESDGEQVIGDSRSSSAATNLLHHLGENNKEFVEDNNDLDNLDDNNANVCVPQVSSSPSAHSTKKRLRYIFRKNKPRHPLTKKRRINTSAQKTYPRSYSPHKERNDRRSLSSSPPRKATSTTHNNIAPGNCLGDRGKY